MMFSVPQFIDIEDRIAGPLTWKQLGWMIAMGAVILVIRTLFDTALTIIVGIPIVLLFVSLAFYKPNGFPMTAFLSNAVLFFFRPKVAVWERPGIAVTPKKALARPIETGSENQEKRLTREKLTELARLMDNRGRSN